MKQVCTLCGTPYPHTTEYFHERGNGRGLEVRCKQCRLNENKKDFNPDGYVPAPVKVKVDCMNKYAGCNETVEVFVPPDRAARKIRKQCWRCNEHGHPDTRDNFGVEWINKHLTRRLRETGVKSNADDFGNYEA